MARNVLIMLIHNGDMDARGGFTLENESRVEEEELEEDAGGDEGTVHTTGTNRTTGSVVEGGGLLCMNRRQTWTLTVYLMTLIPALIFSDIGPVLSLTGEHLRRATGDSTSNGAGTTTNEQDLPVDGIASLGAVEADFRKSYETIISGPRPLWYYLGFFPVWCSIANNGANHMEKKIDDANAATGLMANSGGAANDDSKAALLSPPAKSDPSASSSTAPNTRRINMNTKSIIFVTVTSEYSLTMFKLLSRKRTTQMVDLTRRQLASCL